MKKQVGIIGGILAGILLLFTTAGAENGRNEAIHCLGRDVQLLNLINGLFLSDDQVRILSQKNQEAESARKQFDEEAGQADAQMEDVLVQIRKVLVDGGDIPEDLKTRFHGLKESRRRCEEDLEGIIGTLGTEVENLLTPNQKLTIENYKPCIVPPGQGLIGQSAEGSGEMLVRLLDRVRKMPEARWNLAKEVIADRHIETSERHLGPLDDSTRFRIRQTLLETLEKTRTITDQDFLVQKADMARSLILEKGQALPGSGKVLGKIGRLLLDPRMAMVLEDRFNP